MASFETSLELLQDFFFQAASGSILQRREWEFYRDWRKRLKDALIGLLVWERPRLESSMGVMWPYEGLRQYYPLLESHAERAEDPFKRMQAFLFLAFLPFPQQWRWLTAVERLFPGHPEWKGFIAAERQKISGKIAGKPQNAYKLRHFCQVIKQPISSREKGVLRIFSLPYLFVDDPQLLKQLSQKYVLYVEPPMGIVFRHSWWRYFADLADPCIFGIGSQEDLSFLETQNGVATVPLAH